MYRALQVFDAAKPEGMKIVARAVVAGVPERTELIVETIKTMFYSFWAY
jgi:hypothetical protein